MWPWASHSTCCHLMWATLLTCKCGHGLSPPDPPPHPVPERRIFYCGWVSVAARGRVGGSGAPIGKDCFLDPRQPPVPITASQSICPWSRAQYHPAVESQDPSCLTLVGKWLRQRFGAQAWGFYDMGVVSSTGCLTMGKSRNHSEPQSPHLSNRSLLT